MLPHFYTTDVYWRDGQGILSAFPRPDVAGGPPPEFGGTDRVWSPEHLLLGSAALCFAATLSAVAKKAKVEITTLQCRMEGKLEKTDEGLRLTELILRVALGTPADADRGHRLLETAKRHCIVANALKVPVELRAVVNGLGAEQAARPVAAPV
jgi:organic hydroperoxide reductase OsmC/OhrA